MSSSSPVDQQNPSQQRTVLLASDNSQSIIAEIADGKTNTLVYSAYGEQSAQQEVATRLGFNGQLREARIGWYMLGNGYRAYNPRLMRFHSPDSWSPFGRGGLNPYMYCVGDPVNYSDPTGHAGGFFSSFFSLFKAPNYRAVAPPIISPKAGADAMRSMLRHRPPAEKTHNVSGMFGAFGFIAGPKPKNSWASAGGEIHGSAYSSSTSQNTNPLVPWIVSGRSPDARPGRQTVSTARGSSSHSGQVSSAEKTWTGNIHSSQENLLGGGVPSGPTGPHVNQGPSYPPSPEWSSSSSSESEYSMRRRWDEAYSDWGDSGSSRSSVSDSASNVRRS